jgi:hypothetical protein
MQIEHKVGYIPVTMDELMARFVTQMERDECLKAFKKSKKLFKTNNFRDHPNQVIEQGVAESLLALKNLIQKNTIITERQPNSENSLYLKLMERLQRKDLFNVFPIANSNECRVERTPKPTHLKQ